MGALATMESRRLGRIPARASAYWASTATDPLELYIRTGCPHSFAQIVNGHGRLVLIGCLQVLGNLTDAEDAAQDVFLALARHPERAKGNLAGWLRTVARRKAINLLHSRAARHRREEFSAKPEGGRTAFPEQRQAQVHEELLAAVKRLPTRLREPVRLCYLEGRGQQEAARALGCHQSNLCRRLLQGLGRLRSTLLRRGVVAGAAGLAIWLKTKVGVATAATCLILTAAITVPLAVAPKAEPAYVQGGTPAQWGLPNKIGSYRITKLGPLLGTDYVAYSALLVYGTPGGKLYVRTASTLAAPDATPAQVAAFFDWDALYFTWFYQEYDLRVSAGKQTEANNSWTAWVAKHPMPVH